MRRQGCWIRLVYERNVFVIDLDRVSAFRLISRGRLSFYLPDGNSAIVINQQTDPDTYQKILDYVKTTTGHTLED